MKIFIAGPRAISVLDKQVEKKLHDIYVSNHTVFVGDADGVDKTVQKYYANLKYENVLVYASEGKARNNVGHWSVNKVDIPAHAKGFDYYKAKDVAMSVDADYGLMIWNGESKGTLNNMINLLSADKSAVVYLTRTKSLYIIDSMEKLQTLVFLCGKDAQKAYERLSKVTMSSLFQQASMF